MESIKEFEGQWVFEKDNVVQMFRKYCEHITVSDSDFQSFKKHPDFVTVIGNDVLPKHLSDIYELSLINEGLVSIEELQRFKNNDTVGSPVLYNYDSLGYISPGTLYFANVLADIRRQFGNLQNIDVIEIGSGYGGQAKILLDSDMSIKNYSVIDIPATLGVCKKYLSHFNYTNVKYMTTSEVNTTGADLVISNWCLSELDEQGIQFYVEHVIRHCQYGYFLMNIWDARKDFLLETIKPYFKNINVVPEYPKTHANENWVLIVSK
jgi:putative sugar O-methyltransferase